MYWLSPLGRKAQAPFLQGVVNPEGDMVGAACVCLHWYRELWSSRGFAAMGNVKHGTPGECVTFLVTQEVPWVVFFLHPVKAYMFFFYDSMIC